MSDHSPPAKRHPDMASRGRADRAFLAALSARVTAPEARLAETLDAGLAN